jgi:ATP-dependent exoDNAse (exonuclease V) beta subunit
VTPATKENQIAVSYEYSKLYVALTRAYDRVYIIEDEDGIQFWKNIQLSNLNGDEIDASKYLDFNNYIDPIASCQSEDLKPEIEANKDNYENERNRFRKDPTAIVALVNAIGLGKRLLAKDPSEKLRLELLDLEGERAWNKSRHHAIDDNQRLKLQKEALQKFTEAEKYDKVAPIHYSSKDFDMCLDVLQGYADSNFYSFIKTVCKIKLMSPKDKQKPVDIQNLDELMFCLDPSIIPKGPWSRITPMDDGRRTVENYILKSHKLRQILDHPKAKQHFTSRRLYNSFQG